MADKSSEEDDSEDFKDGVYSEKGREELLDNDEIEPFEQGFMEGADMDGQGAKCRKCGRILLNVDEIIKREIDDENMFFCSDECADKYEEEHG